MAYTGPERRVKVDPFVPQWEDRRGRPRPEPIRAVEDAIADDATVARFHAEQERIAFDHEHGRLSSAIKVAEERAELAGDNDIALELRRLRVRVARHIADRVCSA